jgi:hypothetical protein
LNLPFNTARSTGVLLGPDGESDDDPLLPHAENNVASAAAAVMLQAPAQNERRDRLACVSDIANLLEEEVRLSGASSIPRRITRVSAEVQWSLVAIS